MTKELFSNPDEPQTPAVEPATEAPAAPQTPSFDDHLKKIVNDDGRQKYNDIPTALDGLKNAQDHIKTLTEQLAEAKKKADEAKGIDDVLKQLQQEAQPVAPTSGDSGISQEDALKLVNDALTNKELQDRQNANADALKETLIKRYGDEAKAALAFQEKAKELGVTTEEFKALAVNNPKLVLAHFSSSNTVPDNTTEPKVNPFQLKGEPETELKPVPLGATNSQVIESYRAHAKKTN